MPPRAAPRAAVRKQQKSAVSAFTPVPVGVLTVFTDGACVGNGRSSAKGGYACVWPDHPELTGGWPLRDGETPTNNRAEFTAFLRACKDADVADPVSGAPGTQRTLHVFTDSQLLVKTVSNWLPVWRKNGWKKRDGTSVMNLDLCERIAEACDRRPVRMTHVRAHTTGKDAASNHNRLADELAGIAMRRQERVRPK